ncbi:molybdenum cofactor biosynthesis protein B [Streptomyces sp. NBC_01187]|uniref:MogA/MoaB family molybdenum cofactor biosynthesis protein n=1 Tax=unclassified Streptomyces TaxID=2593676 RepID=UPI00386E033B
MSGPDQHQPDRRQPRHDGHGQPQAGHGEQGRRLPVAAAHRALAVTASNRASAGVYADKGGPLLVEGLTEMGFVAEGPTVVPDGEPVQKALREAVEAGYAVVLTTGGTGISPTDRTPEMTRAVLDYEIPGIPEAIRAQGLAKVPTAALSRGTAGVAGRTLIVNLPGSTGGVRDGLAVLARLLRHAVDQIHGGDHPAEPSRSAGPRHPVEPSAPLEPGEPRGDDPR